MQTFVANIAVFETEVLTKYTDRARMSHAQEFEVREQLGKTVLYRSTADSPSVLGHQSTTCD